MCMCVCARMCLDHLFEHFGLWFVRTIFVSAALHSDFENWCLNIMVTFISFKCTEVIKLYLFTVEENMVLYYSSISIPKSLSSGLHGQKEPEPLTGFIKGGFYQNNDAW